MPPPITAKQSWTIHYYFSKVFIWKWLFAFLFGVFSLVISLCELPYIYISYYQFLPFHVPSSGIFYLLFLQMADKLNPSISSYCFITERAITPWRRRLLSMAIFLHSAHFEVLCTGMILFTVIYKTITGYIFTLYQFPVPPCNAFCYT